MVRLDYLANVQVCQGLDVHQLAKVAEVCREVSFQKDERIFKGGEEADFLYFLQEGEVDLRYDLPGRTSTREMTLTTIKPGGVFGWSIFVPPHRYVMSAYMVGPKSKLMRLEVSDLNRLFEQDSEIGCIFMRNMVLIIGSRVHALWNELSRLDGQALMDTW